MYLYIDIHELRFTKVFIRINRPCPGFIRAIANSLIPIPGAKSGNQSLPGEQSMVNLKG